MFQKILRRVARELKQASIPYMVIGGQADTSRNIFQKFLGCYDPT